MTTALPAGIGVVWLGGVALAAASDRTDRAVDRLALALFGRFGPIRWRRSERATTLDGVHSSDPVAVVAARTVLYAVAIGVGVGLCGLWVIPTVFTGLTTAAGRFIPIDGPDLLVVGESTVLGLSAIGSFVLSLGTAVAVHELRWWLLAQRAAARKRRIDTTLPRAVAFMYALSRSGMPLPRILRTLADNEAVYGEAATELAVAVREIDAFGSDVISALETVSNQTPSDELADLAENLATVVTSGGSLPAYLQSQHEQYREDAAAEQQQYLDLLSACAEGYVTALVVGPLFVVTTLAVIGLVVTETLTALRIVTFGTVPLSTAGFLVGVDRLLDTRRTLPQRDTSGDNDGNNGNNEYISPATISDSMPTADDSRWDEQRATLQLYDRLRLGHDWLRRPVEAVAANPWLTLLVTVPGGVVWLWLTVQLPSLTPVSVADTLVGPLSVVAIGVAAGYAVVYEIAKRRRRRIEHAVPDFLERLAGLNDAGMSVIGGLKEVADGDLGALTPALDAAWRDVRWGADAGTALRRLAKRVRSPVVTSAITLVTNALRASSDIAPVLSIAADELRASQRLARDRKRMMATYLLVIYVAVLVFLGIVAALSASFVPALETTAQQSVAGATASGVPATGGSNVSASEVAAYESLFFQIAVVQAGCSGLVAGKLGEGTVRDGVKHVAVLLCLTHLGFQFI